MSHSVRLLVEDARLIATRLGLKLPLAKARNALAMCLYGAPYSAVMAAEKAQKVPFPSADPARAANAAKVYRCDPKLLLAAAKASLEHYDEEAEEFGDEYAGDFPEDGTPAFGIAMMNCARLIVQGVERHHRRLGGSWADWDSIDAVHDAFGNEITLTFDDCVSEFTSLIDEAINTDGRSLPVDLRAMERECRAMLTDQSSLDTEWISKVEATYAALSKKPAKARAPHRFAIHLLLAPNFETIQPQIFAGKMQAPRVNMHTVDYQEMASILGERFNFRNSRLRVPNDMLDQATMHMRVLGMAEGDPECKDFLIELMHAAESNTDQVVDVRKRWSTMHRLRDRTYAPPPCAISMVLETHDWEDGAQVLIRMRLVLGITAGTPQGLMDGDRATTEGKIDEAFLAYLERAFGMPYKPFVTLTNPYFTNIPKWARGVRD